MSTFCCKTWVTSYRKSYRNSGQLSSQSLALRFLFSLASFPSLGSACFCLTRRLGSGLESGSSGPCSVPVPVPVLVFRLRLPPSVLPMYSLIWDANLGEAAHNSGRVMPKEDPQNCKALGSSVWIVAACFLLRKTSAATMRPRVMATSSRKSWLGSKPSRGHRWFPTTADCRLVRLPFNYCQIIAIKAKLIRQSIPNRVYSTNGGRSWEEPECILIPFLHTAYPCQRPPCPFVCPHSFKLEWALKLRFWFYLPFPFHICLY